MIAPSDIVRKMSSFKLLCFLFWFNNAVLPKYIKGPKNETSEWSNDDWTPETEPEPDKEYSTKNTVEIIKVQKKGHIVCVTDTQESAMYLDPPIIQEAAMVPVFTIDGWQMRNSVESLHTAVVDKRWEDFETISSSHLSFILNKSVSLSMYNSVNKLEFFIDDDTSSNFIALDLKGKNRHWIHYSFLLKEGNVYIFEDNNLIKIFNNFVPKRLVAKAQNVTYWKIHNYVLLYSDTVSQEPTPWIIQPEPENRCLSVYVSLCSTCFLNVTTTSGQNYSFQYSGEKWRKVDLKENIVYYFKGKTDERGLEFWEIDIRQCPIIKYERAIYEVYLDKTEEKNCFTLKSYKQTGRKEAMTQDLRLNCSAGELGEKCSIKCEHLLGNKTKYCEEHEICVDGRCACAWGYHGETCDKQCEDGKWGPSCQNKCTDCCKLCDRFTGECPTETKAISGKASFSYGLIAGILITTIFMVLGKKYLKRKRFESHDTDTNTKTLLK